MTSNSALITEDELDQLEAFLFSTLVPDTALDLVGTHGLFCALNIAPIATAEMEWIKLVFDGEPEWENTQQKEQILTLLRKLYATISNDLYSDQEIILPCELSLETDDEDEDDEAELTIWAQGFMEGLFLNEESWFEEDEETVAGLLLPMMVASDLFEEREVQDIRGDRALAEEMSEQIPEVLVDLYLLFHSPET